MSFIAAASVKEEAPLPHHPFWPEISPADFRAVIGVDGTVTTARLTHALINAITLANDELSAFRRRHEERGVTCLASIPEEESGRLVYLYRRAVYEWAKADLMERMLGFDATAAGQKRSEAQEPVIDDHYRNAIWAIRDILGRRRTTVELI
jgi:hypothetical protein